MRNMPAVSSLQFPIPMETMCRSIVTTIMDEVAKSRYCTYLLKNIALGALTYSDLKIGAAMFPSGDLNDFLRLRFYRVDYQNLYPEGPKAILTSVGKGTTDTIVGDYEDESIFELYWLE